MKILITGSKGFVGLHLTAELSKNNSVVGYDLKEGKNIFNSKLLDKHMNGVDVAVHLAAFVSGIESWDKPEEYLRNNTLGTLKVLQSAYKNRVKRFILFSSAAVYGKPLTPYGASKIGAEAIAECFRDKMQIIIVRPFNIYGKGQNPAYSYVINNFINGIKKSGEIEIFGTGNQTRDFIFIGDVVMAVTKLLRINFPKGAIDLGTGQETKIINLAKVVGKLMNKKFKIIYKDSRQEPVRSRADTKLLKSININNDKFVKLEVGLKNLLS